MGHDVEEREVEAPSKEWPLGKKNIDLNGWQFVVDTCNNIFKKEPAITEEVAKKTLGEIGFKNAETGVNPAAAADMNNPITTYSGGWKVEMQLACAQLINADILMIDDPTGHLDVKNIEWVKNWLGGFPGSIIATSANTQFLNEMCTHIVDFHERKLRQFKATKGEVLTKYVETYPEKASYFELSDKNEQWVFPVPGSLEGVKSRGRTILKMQDVTFKYPTHEKNTVENITLTVCMASRVAVVGANGAGKSTAIKLLIGELKPDSGTIWRHQNMRLDKTAVDYILWRFAGADDRESLENQNQETNEDDEKKRETPWFICPKSLEVKKCDMSDTPEGKKKRAMAIAPDAILNRQNPHIIILDEPTNYLDRDGLGALVRGLEAYRGGVVIISHNVEFTDSVCQQKWIMAKDPTTGSGRLREEGAIVDDEQIEGEQGPDEIFDESGNKIVVKKKMEAKDIKKEIKDVEKKLKANAKDKNLSEEDVWELGDRLAELKQMLEAKKD